MNLPLNHFILQIQKIRLKMNKSILTLLFIITALFSCDSKETTGNSKDYVVVIHTPFGDMTAILYDETPLHKANFIKLAKEGQYDSTIFHRVMKGFMIQGGDVDAKNKTRSNKNVTAEFVNKFLHDSLEITDTKSISSHCFRSSLISDLLDTVNPVKAQKIIGHSNIKTTLGYYNKDIPITEKIEIFKNFKK